MFSNLRKATNSDVGMYDGGDGRHPSSLRELGALLRERREAMGVSLAEVEVATRIRQKYLSALEADEWHLLPGEVVGRGFLRNYADYLGLEPDEAIERRRAVTDIAMSSVLSSTSAGAPLPPLRDVDYRPKEVDLKDEGDGIQRGEIRLTPIFAIVGVALMVVAAWWSISVLAAPLGEFVADVPGRVAAAFDQPAPTPTLELTGIVNPQNLGMTEPADGTGPETVLGADSVAPQGNEGGMEIAANEDAAGLEQTEGQAALPQASEGTGGPVAADTGGQIAQQGSQDSGLILVPTNTPEQADAPAPAVEPTPTFTPEPPTPEPPAPTPVPEIPTPEPVVELPTPTPEAVVQALAVATAACADGRSVISSPGMNQALAGTVGVTGAATHDNFQYYKLEYAPGANAADGFVYFAGSSGPVGGGLLGNLDTQALANGDYTLRLTVVDQTGNFPPPCEVSVSIQN